MRLLPIHRDKCRKAWREVAVMAKGKGKNFKPMGNKRSGKKRGSGGDFLGDLFKPSKTFGAGQKTPHSDGKLNQNRSGGKGRRR